MNKIQQARLFKLVTIKDHSTRLNYVRILIDYKTIRHNDGLRVPKY